VKTRDGIVGRPTDRGRPIRGHGATRPREPDQASIHGTHQGLGPTAAPTGRTHDRKRPSVPVREILLASRGPSTHVLGPAEGRTRGAPDCASPRWSRSSSATSTPSACCCGSSKARVVQGKGRKDRNAMLSPQLLELLRT